MFRDYTRETNESKGQMRGFGGIDKDIRIRVGDVFRHIVRMLWIMKVV